MKFIAWISGVKKIVSTIAASTGATDADKIPATDGNGKLDNSFIKSVTTTAGVGDASKFVLTNASGVIDSSLYTAGANNTVTVLASEALTAGNWVNIYNNAGTPNVRKADNSASKQAHGFVLSAVSNGANALVYISGINTQVTGKTAGAMYYLGTSGGDIDQAAAGALTTSGVLIQNLGVAVSATSILFEYDEPVTIN